MLGLVTGKLTGIDQDPNEFRKSTGNLEIVFLFFVRTAAGCSQTWHHSFEADSF